MAIGHQQQLIFYHFFYKCQYKSYENFRINSFMQENIPFIQHRGEFYYDIVLKDDTKINAGFLGTVSAKDDKDIYLALKELDEILVKTGAQKTVDSKYFNIGVKDLDKLYANRIRSILLNIR
ncbi:hypothetical protein OSC52_06885 [Clostridium pasteurianum]|nr:hypothetical protein [Clostridium pasteurianum]ELP58724.1 hypothetical protein F502_13113 [Clostridium pasteurianum DSM 525 = ATCC 6013]UZW15558.1 hypothetical protein OSC52_06885 [Clostridium pasteurianum]